MPDDLDVAAALLRVLGSPNVASREHVYRHYESEVKGNTLVRPGEADACVVAPVPGSDVGVAVAVGGNPSLGGIDAYEAGAAAVAEAVRNVAAAGAVPLAITDCLNFGNPEAPEVFHDFVEAVRGIGDAARGIGLKDTDEPLPGHLRKRELLQPVLDRERHRAVADRLLRRAARPTARGT